MDSSPAQMLDAAEIERVLGVLAEPGQTFEFRILEAQRAGSQHPVTITGCFDNPALALTALQEQRLARAKGFYITLNPVDPALLARNHNRLAVARRGETTADCNILRRRWMLVDCDPVRPPGVSANAEEKARAEERCLSIRETLRGAGWPDPVRADSGNGYHLLYRVELPSESDLVKRCLDALALRFDDNAVSVDRAVANPSRIVKLYGTLTQKGDHCPDIGRVHRMSKLLDVPVEVKPVPVALLESLAGHVEHEEKPPAGERRRKGGSSHGAWDRDRVQAFIDSHLRHCNPEAAVPYDGGWKWILHICPFNPEHTNHSAVVVIRANGTLGFRCLHNSCTDLHWKDLRAKFEPKPAFAVPSAEKVKLMCAGAASVSTAENDYGPALIGTAEVQTINQMHFAKRYVADSGTIHDPTVRRFFTYFKATGLWQHQTDETTLREIAICFHRIVKEEGFLDILAKRTANLLQGLRELARGIAERRNVFNQRRDVIHVANGMLALNEDGSVELKPFAPEWYSRNRSEIAWNPHAVCPRFLHELLLAAMDEDDVGLIQRFMGQCLLGMNLAQIFLVLRGMSGGGKTTLANVIELLIGRFNVTELRIAQLCERFEFIRYVGRTLLTGKDVPGDFLNMRSAHVLKALVGGDTLEGEVKHGNESFSIEGRFNVLISTNTRLRVKLDSDKAAWRRRMLIIDYVRPKPDKPIPDFDQLLLREEGEGILRWAVEGAIMVRRELAETGRIHLTEAQSRRVDDLLSESDSVRSFVQECIVKCPGGEVAIHELTAAYRDYCDNRNWEPLRDRQFQADLPEIMMDLHRAPRRNDVRRDGKNIRGFCGVCLKSCSEIPFEASAAPLTLPLSDDPGSVPCAVDSAPVIPATEVSEAPDAWLDDL